MNYITPENIGDYNLLEMLNANLVEMSHTNMEKGETEEPTTFEIASKVTDNIVVADGYF